MSSHRAFLTTILTSAILSTALISDMGYEALPTGDAEEALRLIRFGRCRLVLASVHLDAQIPTTFSTALCAVIRAFTSL